MSVVRLAAAASMSIAFGVAIACSSFDGTDSEPTGDAGAGSDTSTSIEDATSDGAGGDGGTSDGGRAKRLYVYAGYGDTSGAQMTADAWSAEILPDGAIANWSRAPELDARRYFAASALTESGAVVLAGGVYELTDAGPRQAYSTSVVSASLDPIAVLAPAPPLPIPLAAAAATASGSYIFVSGGQTIDNYSRDAIWVTRRDTNGALLPWDSAGVLPQRLAHHGFATIGDQIYVVGGADNEEAGNVATAQTWHATVGNNGMLGSFTPTGALPEPVWVHRVVAAGGRLYSIGGRSGVSGDITNAVNVGTIGAGGAVSWAPTSPLPTPVVIPCAAASNGKIYVMGGFALANDPPLTKVYVGSIGAAGSVAWTETTSLPMGRGGAACAAY